MNKITFFGKLVYAVNTLAAFLLIVSFILPYLPPSTFPTLSLLSLAVSPLILLNLLFALYWLIRLKKKFLLSFAVLIVAYFHFNPFFEISSEGDPSSYDHSLSVLSFNVRLFNAYEKENSEEKVADQISKLLTSEQPDVFAVQEYYAKHQVDFSSYPYQFIHFKDSTAKLGHAIFSKYPLANTGAFNFNDSYNNTIYADVVVKEDTVRVYNIHLQSLGILPSVGFIQQRGTEKIKKRIAQTFVQQQEQVGKILTHKKRTSLPVVFAGDFNNTPFSYTYKQLQKDMKDAFLERGNGLGTTYSFQNYPMRIDYILTSENFDVLNFEAITETFSDHYPVKAVLGW